MHSNLSHQQGQVGVRDDLGVGVAKDVRYVCINNFNITLLLMWNWLGLSEIICMSVSTTSTVLSY